MPLPKQFFLAYRIPSAYLLLLIAFMMLASCRQQHKKLLNTSTAQEKQENLDKEIDPVAPPKITLLTAANQPQVIKAGKPTMVVDSTGMGTPFFTNYTIDNGLPINYITYCMQDNKGGLWIGTGGGGLVHYNGRSFTIYTTANGLRDNFIENIFQDKRGNIWVSTISNGVSKYDGNTFTNYTVNEGLADNLVLGIAQDNNGNMWFATRKGASRFNGTTFTNYTTDQGLAGNSVDCLLKAKNGALWFGCRGAGISRYDGKSFTNYTAADGLCGNTIYGMTQLRNGDIWITTYGEGASKFDGKTFTNYSTKDGLASNVVLGSMEDKDGNLWLGTLSNGVSIFNGNTFTTYTTAEGLLNNTVGKIMQDKSGSIWLCTNKGLTKYDGPGVSAYNQPAGAEHIMQDKAGTIWFSSFLGGITSYDGKQFLNYSKPQGLVTDMVFYAMQDTDNHIWIGTANGATKFDGKQFINYSTAQGLTSGIYCILQDKEGNIWFGSNNGSGIYKFDGKSFTNFAAAQGLAGTTVYTMVQDKQGDLWLGTNGGISRYNGKYFINYIIADGLVANSAYCAVEDKQGNLWFGSGANGVNIYNGKRFIAYTTAEGLADNTVNAVAADNDRNMIWFGTNHGISGLRQAAGITPFSPAEIFNISTGYPIKNFNNNGLLVDKQGIMWGGCESSVIIRFDYDAVNKNLQSLTLQLESIKLNGEKICWNNLYQNNPIKTTHDSLVLLNEMVATFGNVLPGRLLDSMRNKFSKVRFDSVTPFYFIPVNLVVPYDDRNITFEFAAIEPNKPKQVKYQYLLEGYDNNWSPLSNNTTAVFGNIPEGVYVFKLKALSPDGVWSETDYTFKVLPPWWRTWWAYTIYILFFGAVTFLIGRILQQRLIKKERAKSELRELEMQALRAQMNPHFIFNCLSSINRFVLMNETEAASDYLTKFSKLIRTVLNNSKKSLISLQDELEMLRLYIDMEKLRFKDGFDYSIEVNKDVATDCIFIPPLLFQPFAENAVWHGLMHKNGQGLLRIHLHVANDILYFSIEDNGVGRTAAGTSGSKTAEKNKSLGLQITKDRLALINGYTSENTFFEIEDLKDHAGAAAGTRVLLKIKFSETQDGNN